MIFVLLFIVLTVIILIVIPRLYLNSEEKKRFKQDLNKVYKIARLPRKEPGNALKVTHHPLAR